MTAYFSRPRAVVAITALLALPAGPSALAAQDSVSAFPSDTAVLAILKQRVNEKRSAGIVVGLVEPNGRTRIISNGDPGPGQPPLDGNSVFEIGSITKVFASTVLAQLVMEGKLSLELTLGRT